jgi:pimeloyl-ACP methyl ester carboxylesterase
MHIFYNNSKVAYQKVGQGQILVLLHGFCEDSTMWADFVPLLSKKYTILTIDLSGFGDSDLLKNTGISAMADAALAVLEVEKVESCILIGHSMGGYVGLALAEKKPEILLGLGLLHSHPYKDSQSKTQNRLKTIGFIQRHGIAPFAGHFVRNLFPPDFVEHNKQFVEELIHKTSMHHSDAVIAASHAMIERDDRTAVLTNLACPALFIVGTLDNAIPTEHSFKQLSLPKIASVHILENVGHMGMFEAPVETLEIIVDFIDFCTVYKANLTLPS